MQAPEITPTPRRNPVESGVGSGLDSVLQGSPLQAFQLRSQYRYALHPVEAALQYHGASTQGPSAPCDVTISFEQAESHYRAGSQGLRLSEIPQLPQQLRELSRLGTVDRSGRKALRKWAEEHDHVIGENLFLQHWKAQGQRGGANTYISLARLGTWAAIKLADVGYPTPPDGPTPIY